MKPPPMWKDERSGAWYVWRSDLYGAFKWDDRETRSVFVSERFKPWRPSHLIARAKQWQHDRGI